jgi:hypothetical protein
MAPLGDEAQVEACFDPFRQILTQDRCTACVKRTIGSEINFETPDGFLGDMDHVKSYFFLFGESVRVGAR